MRVIITGGRDRDDRQTIWAEMDALANLHNPLTVVHGACPSGADMWAAAWCRDAQRWPDQQHVVEERHPADWKRYGRRAGFVRNQEMVDLGADLVLAFPGAGPGTRHTIDLANAAGIHVSVIPVGGAA